MFEPKCLIKKPSIQATLLVLAKKMNSMQQKRSASVPITRPLTCAFAFNEPIKSSGSEHEQGFATRRKTNRSIVHIDMPRKLKKSLNGTDWETDSLFNPTRRLRGKKKGKQVSEKRFQTGSISSSSSDGIGTRARYRLPSPKDFRKQSHRKKPIQSRDDTIVAASSSSSCWTGSSGNEASRDSTGDDEIKVPDAHHDVDAYEDFAFNNESLYVQDCYEQVDTLVLQLTIPMETRLIEKLDVEYQLFKIMTLKPEAA
jgi:hypothetical protein